MLTHIKVTQTNRTLSKNDSRKQKIILQYTPQGPHGIMERL